MHFHAGGDGVFGAERAYSEACRFRPRNTVVAFDSDGVFRKNIYPKYKEKRSERPPELSRQLEQSEKLLSRMGATIVKVDGFEADDILATLARKSVDSGVMCVIMSSDKDLWQCLSSGKVGMYTKSGGAWGFIGEKDVVEKTGFSGKRYVEYQSLTGDSTDGIPGAAGIGPKRAKNLLDSHGSLDNLRDKFESDDSLSDSIKESLRDFFANEERNVSLVRLRDDVPFSL